MGANMRSFGMRRQQIAWRYATWFAFANKRARAFFPSLAATVPRFQKRLASFPTVPTDPRGKSPTSMP
jgi:hypothetical protein